MPNIISQIRKRSGEIVDFDREKILSAIKKGQESVGVDDPDLAEKLTNQIIDKLARKFHFRSIPAVEEIQDVVEETLIEGRQIVLAKAFILYRDQHRQLRDLNAKTSDEKLMEDYLGQADWRLKENSNMSFSVQGLNNYLASSISAKYWLNKLYPVEIRDAHVNADLHIHDLGMLASYCAGWNLKDLLIRGFAGVDEKTQSGPAKHFRSALGQLVNFLYTMQGELAGACAVSNFDTYLAPFIRYDNLTKKEVRQALQEFVFNMNVPTRVGFQSPFTNVTLDVKPIGTLAEECVIIGGKIMPEKYKDFQKEMDMFNETFAEIMLDGDSKHRMFSFPIPTYNIDRTFEWDRPSLKGVWEMTAKYGIPYFSNFVNSDMKPEDARSMCCRLRLDNRELRKRGGGLFGANPLTGSIGVVTINLARIGYLSKDKEEFKQRLSHLMDLAKESLEIKRKILERFTDDGLYPYSKFYLSDVKARFGKYWQNHFSTIGINGMNEALLNFMKRDIASEEGKKFAIEMLDFMREVLKNYQNETNNLYNLEATPAEGTTYRFAKKDKEVYPNILVANDEAVKKGADPYYTNSTHLPVNYTNDIFEALELQDELQTKYTGGTVLHGFLGQKISDPEAAKALVKKIVYGYHLPYFTITPTFSICPKHGYLDGEHKYCPKCDEENGYRELGSDVSTAASEKVEEIAIRPDVGFIAEAGEVEEQLIPETASSGSNERNIINAIA
jgi:anaerobic ribonucleoside-triphosphate reductase